MSVALNIEDVGVRNAGRGDEGAFRALVEDQRAALHAHCYRMLGTMHDADDALQDTLLRAWRGLPRFHGQSSVRTWLYRIATNVCIDAESSSGLDHKPGSQLYHVQWKTNKAWDGQCRDLAIELVDGARQGVRIDFR